MNPPPHHILALAGALAGSGLTLFLLLPLACFGLEILVNGWRQSSLRAMLTGFDRSHANDLTFLLLGATSLLGWGELILTLGVSYLGGHFWQAAIRQATGHNLRIDTGHAALNLLIYILAWSFVDYWNHRIEHWGPFWLLHRMHHSNTSMSPLVRYRANPAEQGFELFRKVWPIALIAAPDAGLFIFTILQSAYISLVHADLPWRWGWFGRWILIAPAAHRLHHSALPEHQDKNFGTLAMWDHLFRTWHEPDPSPYPLGLAEPVHNRRLGLLDCAQDALGFWRQTARLMMRLAPAKQTSSSR